MSVSERLEYLRGEIRAERISYGEIAELQSLWKWIDAGDEELLGWARPEVEGRYTGHLREGVMDWECPFTGELKSCQGEFECDGEYYIHKVTDEDNRVIYTVKAI